MLRVQKSRNETDWEKYLLQIVGVNNRPLNATTGIKPFKLLTIEETATPVTLNFQSIRNRKFLLKHTYENPSRENRSSTIYADGILSTPKSVNERNVARM